MTEIPSQRLRYIDTLRGVAALLVMIQHSMDPTIPTPSVDGLRAAELLRHSQPFSLIPDMGQIGVMLFFLISGFVVPFSFKGKHPLRAFVVGRVFRLYPAYWLSLGVGLAVFTFALGQSFSWEQGFANITMMQKVFGHRSVLGSYWTLFIELQFYAMCVVAYFFRWLQSPWYLGGIILAITGVIAFGAIYPQAYPHAFVSANTLMYVAMMHAGALIRLSVVEKQKLANAMLPVALLLLGGAFPFAFQLQLFMPDRLHWAGETTSFYIALVLFWLCVKTEFFNPALAFCGMISYSLYLFHPAIFPLIHAYIGTPANDGVAVLGALLGITITIFVAWAVYVGVERPCIHFSRRTFSYLLK